ncbi:hypothetical protein ATHL_00998 [Anaerolinea thermolimosa]|nr:hypothetical protein ATHL_00998 [Anaerolinea thermolimosa]
MDARIALAISLAVLVIIVSLWLTRWRMEG